MKEFIQKHAAAVIGILSGFDRVLFRGTLRALMYEAGMMGYLSGASVRLTEFGRHADWCKLLNGLAAKLNPAHGHIFKCCLLSYYWTAPQTEWATDVMFKDAGSLQQVYPWLVREAIAAFGAVDVLRFLGKRVATQRQQRQDV